MALTPYRGTSVSPYRAITPEVARVAFSGMFNPGTVRYAARAARFVNSPAGRAFGRAAFRYVKRKRQNNVSDRGGIGTNSTFGTSQKEVMNNGTTQNFNSRSFYFNDMTDIVKATGSNEINARQRQLIHVKGCAIHVMLRTLRDVPITFNIAVINGRNNNAAAQPDTDGFFREYTSSRDVNFTTALNNNQIHTYPISTDKWRVLMHKRFCFAGKSSSTGDWATGTMNNIINRQMYVPINRNITYNDDVGELSEAKIWLVFWFDQHAAAGGSAVVNDVVIGSVRSVTYFDEVVPQIKRYKVGTGTTKMTTIN